MRRDYPLTKKGAGYGLVPFFKYWKRTASRRLPSTKAVAAGSAAAGAEKRRGYLLQLLEPQASHVISLLFSLMPSNFSVVWPQRLHLKT